jgi:hypothetical protein
MTPQSIPAHFDGKQIQLDQPVALEANAKLLVVVLPEHDEERDDWIRAAQASLGRAYGDNEPEYTLGMIKEPNPDYLRH